MSTSRRAAAILAAGAFTLLTAGCGNAAEKVSEKAVEKAIESETGGDVDINTDGEGSFSVETEDGSFSTSANEVPDGWPEDVTLPDGIEITTGSAMDASDGRLLTITASSDTSPAELFDEVKATLSGWDISAETSSTSSSGDLYSAQWAIDGRRVTFLASSGPDGTALTLSHTTIE